MRALAVRGRPVAEVVADAEREGVVRLLLRPRRSATSTSRPDIRPSDLLIRGMDVLYARDIIGFDFRDRREEEEEEAAAIQNVSRLFRAELWYVKVTRVLHIVSGHTHCALYSFPLKTQYISMNTTPSTPTATPTKPTPAMRQLRALAARLDRGLARAESVVGPQDGAASVDTQALLSELTAKTAALEQLLPPAFGGVTPSFVAGGRTLDEYASRRLENGAVLCELLRRRRGGRENLTAGVQSRTCAGSRPSARRWRRRRRCWRS